MNFRMMNLLQNQNVINLVTKSVLDEDGYHFVHAVWANDSCYILYLPQPQITSHAIILAIQANVTKESMKRSIEQCLQVHERYDIQPCFVLLCTDKISSSVKTLLSPTLNNPYWQQISNTLWAEKCLIISKDTIECGDNEIKQHLDPLVALAWHFSHNKEQKRKLQSIDDPTIQLLNVIDSEQ